MGSNVAMTRTRTRTFSAGALRRLKQSSSPDFSQVAKHADWWVPVNAGQDGAFWMAANHVILKEFHAEHPTPYFIDYVKRYTDSPFLVVLDRDGDSYTPGRLLRASQLEAYADAENAGAKFLVWDSAARAVRMPQARSAFAGRRPKTSGISDEDGVAAPPSIRR